MPFNNRPAWTLPRFRTGGGWGARWHSVAVDSVWWSW